MRVWCYIMLFTLLLLPLHLLMTYSSLPLPIPIPPYHSLSLSLPTTPYAYPSLPLPIPIPIPIPMPMSSPAIPSIFLYSSLHPLSPLQPPPPSQTPHSTPHRLLVRLVRRNLPSRPVVLAIGDGANDVAMIQEADIGERRVRVRCYLTVLLVLNSIILVLCCPSLP